MRYLGMEYLLIKKLNPPFGAALVFYSCFVNTYIIKEDEMKISRYIYIFLSGLIISIFVYPFLHELGHSILTLILGGKISGFSAFPIPYIECELNKVNDLKIIIAGIGGIAFPILFTIMIYSKHFSIWLLGLYLNIVCFLSTIISIYACIRFILSNPIINEDITTILMLTSGNAYMWIIVFAFLMIALTTQIILSHPIKRCYNLNKK